MLSEGALHVLSLYRELGVANPGVFSKPLAMARARNRETGEITILTDPSVDELVDEGYLTRDQENASLYHWTSKVTN